MDSAIRDTREGCLLPLRVIPRSSRNQVVGFENGVLKVKVQAPPVEGAANEAVLRFLAEWLNRPKNCLVLLKGEQSRHKLVRVTGLKAAEVLELLAQQKLKGR